MKAILLWPTSFALRAVETDLGVPWSEFTVVRASTTAETAKLYAIPRTTVVLDPYPGHTCREVRELATAKFHTVVSGIDACRTIVAALSGKALA